MNPLNTIPTDLVNYNPFEIIRSGYTGVYVYANSTLQKDFALSNYVPITGLNRGFGVKPDNFIYLQVLLGSDYTATGAYIVCDYVGIDADDDGWLGYPDPIETVPPDVIGPNGNILTTSQTKLQTKAYILIGYTTTGNNEPEPAMVLGTGLGVYGKDRFKLIQCVDTNLIMMYFCRNGVPVGYPFPFPTSPPKNRTNIVP